MAKIKKITVYLFSAILTISLIAGYFCFMPRMAQAASVSMIMSGMFFSECQDTPITSRYILSNVTPVHAITPCCLAKKGNSQSSAVNLNNFSLDNVDWQSILSAQIINNDSANCAVSFDYPISPTQTELLSSVIIRD